MPDPFETDPEYWQALLANLLLGHVSAGRKLYNLLDPTIRCVANRLIGRGTRQELKNDLVQDVWVHLCKNNYRVLQQWSGNRPLQHYIAVVASNKMRDQLSRSNRPEDPPDPDNQLHDPPATGDDPERALEVKQFAECRERAKARLSETYRTLIDLRHGKEMKHREIAELLGKTTGYVGPALARAERHLRDEIRATCPDLIDSFQSIFRE